MDKNFFLGILLGAAIGAGVGLMLAPRTGSEIRGQIADTSKAAANRVSKVAASVVGRATSEEEIRQAI